MRNHHSLKMYFLVFNFAVAVVVPVRAAGLVLVWSDEFNQPAHSAPDLTKWSYDLGHSNGWGNNELETYTDARTNSAIVPDPDATDGKALAITALKDASGRYTSARLKTQQKFSVKYGRIEARLRTVNGRGLWPAFWMLGENLTAVGWPECGEIDVMEVVGDKPAVLHGTLHGPGYSGGKGIGSTYTLSNGATFDSAYHVFAVDRSPGKIAWSVDGNVYHTVTPASLPIGTRWVFDNAPFFLLLDLAVGGNWPGMPDRSTTFPQSLVVDYVRVYSLPQPGH
jgi:beta-glucanase (GH16 family)